MENQRLLRFAAPALYKKMVETFSANHLHPYDVLATVIQDEQGFEVRIRFSTDYSLGEIFHVSFEQAMNPDQKVKRIFEETAEKCKTQLIADYFKMIKL